MNSTLKELIQQVAVLDLELSRKDREISQSIYKKNTKLLLTDRNAIANKIDEILHKAIERNSELR